MPGITLNSPLTVNQGGQNTSDVTGSLETAIDQTRGQTSDFSSKLTDPGFNSKSEMGLMLKLQREIQLETQMYTAVSNTMAARDSAKKTAINNFKG
jgi:hypothetical protein